MKRFFGDAGRFLLGFGILTACLVALMAFVFLILFLWDKVASEGFREVLAAILGFGLLGLSAGLFLFGSWEIGNVIVEDRARQKRAKENGLPVSNVRPYNG